MTDLNSTSDPQSTTPPAAAHTPESNGGQATEPLIPKSRLDEVLKENRELKKAQDAATAARSKADDDAAREQGRWKELAEKHATRLAELEGIQAKADRYEAALNATLEVQRKGLSEDRLELLGHLDPAEQLEWIAKHGETARAATNGSGSVQRGNAPNPRGGQAANPREENVKSNYESLRAGGSYSRF